MLVVKAAFCDNSGATLDVNSGSRTHPELRVDAAGMRRGREATRLQPLGGPGGHRQAGKEPSPPPTPTLLSAEQTEPGVPVPWEPEPFREHLA